MDWLKKRLKERSTWLGIISVVTSLGIVTIQPEMAEQIATALVAVVGVVLAIMKERTAE